MWFAIHVKPGTERQAVGLLRDAAASSGLEELFSPEATVAYGEGDTFEVTALPMIPGCVVAVAPSKWEVRRALRRSSGIECLLDGDASFDAMQDGEIALIDAFTHPGDRTAQLSEGVVDNGRVVVRRGPLYGRERMIRNVSCRKRKAYLETSVAGEPVTATVGLRVSRKPDHDGSVASSGLSRVHGEGEQAS